MDYCYKDKYKEEIMRLLKTLKGEQFNICAQIYHCILEATDNQAELLQYFLEISEDIESEGQIEAEQVFTKGEFIDCKETYGKIVDGILEKTLSKRETPTQFYAELWNLINSEQVFETEQSRIFALYYVSIDARIPYYQLKEGLNIDQETYAAIVKKMSDKLKRARFILCCGLKSWTEVTSLLCEILDEAENDTEKAVLLAIILQLYNNIFVRVEMPENSEEDPSIA